MLCGLPASPGIAIGRAAVLKKAGPSVVRRELTEKELAGEMERWQQALAAAKAYLSKVMEKVDKELGKDKADIFGAQLLMLEDPALLKSVEEAICCRMMNVEAAVSETTDRLARQLESVPDEYISQRGADIRACGDLILAALHGRLDQTHCEFEGERVVVARALTPADTANLDRKRVLGFVTEEGGRTSHVAILARTLGIPAVVGVSDLLSVVREGDLLIVDGEAGRVYVNPDQATLEAYRSRLEAFLKEEALWQQLRDLPAVTRDGEKVEIMANIGGLQDVEAALRWGAEGVGLFRTEFLFLDREQMPDEEEQYESYRSVVERFRGKPVIIRTLDIGGDKPVPYLAMPEELNPFLGCRGIRLCLQHTKVFLTQIKAILRAARHGDVRIMFPMVATLEEVEAAKSLVSAAYRELDREGKPHGTGVPLGIMVETPSAAVCADVLAEEVEFFSIGTNDLTQYVLAVDRANEKVAELYDPFQLAVLRLVESVIAAGHRFGKAVGMCGEMAGDPRAIPILLGMGLREFSMAPASIPRAKAVVRALTLEEARELARWVMGARTLQDVRTRVSEIWHRVGNRITGQPSV